MCRHPSARSHIACSQPLPSGRYCELAMADEPSTLIILKWALENPEKSALGMVMLAGVWQWLREFRRVGRGDNERDSVLDTLMKEIIELRKDRDNLADENRELRKEIRESRRRNGSDPNSGRPPSN